MCLPHTSTLYTQVSLLPAAACPSERPTHRQQQSHSTAGHYLPLTFELASPTQRMPEAGAAAEEQLQGTMQPLHTLTLDQSKVGHHAQPRAGHGPQHDGARPAALCRRAGSGKSRGVRPQNPRVGVGAWKPREGEGRAAGWARAGAGAARGTHSRPASVCGLGLAWPQTPAACWPVSPAPVPCVDDGHALLLGAQLQSLHVLGLLLILR